MIELEDFNKLVDEIVEQGFNEETASELAEMIGDTPIYNEAGNIVVMDGAREVAILLPLKFFAEE